MVLTSKNLLMYGNNEPCWSRRIHILLKHLNMDHMLTHPENFTDTMGERLIGLYS